MRTTFTVLLAGAIAALPASAEPAKPTAAVAAASAPMSDAECAVWSRELSFAKSVEAHDASAFAEHLHRGAVFGAGSAAPVRGRAAVVADWKDIIEGATFVLRWHPQFVSIGADPAIALSSGPAWTEDRRPAAKQRHTISRFTSTWIRGNDGQWRVLFDGSGEPPRAATAAEIAKLVAAQPAACPRG